MPNNDRPDHAKIRRFSRHHVDVRLTTTALRDGKELKFTGQGRDISLGGLALHIAADLAVGEIVWMEFTLPYSRLPLRVQARVSNREESRYGMEFLTLTAEQRDGIQRLCDTLTLLDS